MTTLPSGLVSFLMTDIERSTELLRRLGRDPYEQLLVTHRELIASAIEAREPVLAESVSVSQAPLFAFAELENAGNSAQRVRVTFERQGEGAKGKSVGHVELAIPASSARWRTWAKTQLVDEPGQWAAVLRDEQGHELARTPFEVSL